MNCKLCGKEMKLREKKDHSSKFWGCSGFPNCRGIERYTETPVANNTIPKNFLYPATTEIKEEGKINLAIDRAIDYCKHTHTRDTTNAQQELKQWAEYFFYLPDQLKDHLQNINEINEI